MKTAFLLVTTVLAWCHSVCLALGVSAKDRDTPPANYDWEDESDHVHTAPHEDAFQYTESVIDDAELRNGDDLFVPEGTHSNVDISDTEHHEIDAVFAQDPSIFKNCMLIRDYAEPLRVGSAMMATRSQLRGGALASEGEGHHGKKNSTIMMYRNKHHGHHHHKGHHHHDVDQHVYRGEQGDKIPEIGRAHV